MVAELTPFQEFDEIRYQALREINALAHKLALAERDGRRTKARKLRDELARVGRSLAAPGPSSDLYCL